MTRLRLVWGLFGLALLSGIAFIAISNATVIPMVAKGSGPDSVQVTASGWLALVTSGLSASGFTLAGFLAFVAGRIGNPFSGASSDKLISEFLELSTSFAALMRDKTNRAAQRRFVFAIADAANLIQGCQTSHEAGVVVIKYSGYATPITSSEQGAKP